MYLGSQLFSTQNPLPQKHIVQVFFQFKPKKTRIHLLKNTCTLYTLPPSFSKSFLRTIQKTGKLHTLTHSLLDKSSFQGLRLLVYSVRRQFNLGRQKTVSSYYRPNSILTNVRFPLFHQTDRNILWTFQKF